MFKYNHITSYKCTCTGKITPIQSVPIDRDQTIIYKIVRIEVSKSNGSSISLPARRGTQLHILMHLHFYVK